MTNNKALFWGQRPSYQGIIICPFCGKERKLFVYFISKPKIIIRWTLSEGTVQNMSRLTPYSKTVKSD